MSTYLRQQTRNIEIKAEPKTFHFDLPKDLDNNLKREIDSITKHN